MTDPDSLTYATDVLQIPMLDCRRRWLTMLLPGLFAVTLGGWPETARADPEPQADDQNDTEENPITGFFQQIFGGGGDPDIRAELAVAEEGQFKDNVDARASSDPQLTKRLSSADWHIARQDWHAAIETLQPLLGEHSDTLCRNAEGDWTSLQSEVEARIGRLPDDGLQAYRTAYEGLASEMLNAGGGLSDYQTCMNVARRYFHTKAGYQAANSLALHHFDSGQFTQAAYWFSRLASVVSRPEWTDSAEWRAMAAFAVKQGAQTDGPIATSAQLNDWPMFYGSADHRALAGDGRPILLRRWSVPLTARYVIRTQVEDLLLDLADNSRPPVPAWQPIMVDGKVAFRTLRGLSVVDVRTGEVLWETASDVSAERLLSGEPDDASVLPTMGLRQLINEYGVDQQDNHQLASLLFRDATYGLLSSNGRLLFSIEQQALMAQANYGYWWSNVNPSDEDPYQRDWSSNQLVAFDLDSGRPVWEVGGRRMEEPFDPPLAGAYLFGPPVPAGDELFVIGEQGSEIRLFVLRAATGEPLWSLPLAGVSTRIAHDAVRRQWAAQPAVEAGLVVCPTTVGWLVAVDWRQRRIRWAHRYSERTESMRSHRGFVLNSQQPLGTRWCQSAPILVAGRVLYAPSEQPDETGVDQPRLTCLNALSGEVLWDRPKGAGLYVAGVVGETVVIVERGAVVGVSLADGESRRWSVELPPDVMPSGRGVLQANRLVLPVNSGELLTLDLETGEFETQQSPSGSDLLPGNLAIHAGTLVSLGPRGIEAFELRDSVEAEIARRRIADPDDVWAALREAEMFQLNGENARALELLDRASPFLQDSLPELIERHQRLTFDCLLRICTDDPGGSESEFARLETVAQSEQERFSVQRLDARRRLAVGDSEGAFEVYWRMIGRPAPGFVQTGQVDARFDVWLAGQLQDVWAAADSDVRGRLDIRIQDAIERALDAEADEQSHWERLLGFHPATWRLTWSLIDAAVDRDEFAPAEVRLRRLIAADVRGVAADALSRLGQLLVDFDLRADAAECFARLEDEYADVVLKDGRTGAEHAAERFAEFDLTRDLLASPPVGIWSGYRFEIENRRTETGSALVQPVTLTSDGAGFFSRHRFEFEPNTQQLVISPTGTAAPYWSTPLRMGQQQIYNQSAAVAAHGLQALVFHRGVLHAMSLPDRRILWTEPVDRVGSAYTRHVVADSVAPMQPVSRFLAQSALNRRAPQHGMLAHACASYIARYGRREVRVLDPLTGQVLWTCSGVLPQTKIFGDEQSIYLVARDGSTRALRGTDGRLLEMPDLKSLVEKAVVWRPRSAILVERGAQTALPGVRRSKLAVRAVDPRTSDTQWSLDFEDRARLSLIDDRTLLVLEPAGDCHVVDFDTAQATRLGTLPENLMEVASQIHAVADSEYIYLLVDHLPNQTVSYVNPPIVRVNGTVFAMHRNGAGIAWQRRVENQNLLLTQFEHSPLMVFLSYQSELEEALRFSYFQVRVLALDKQTGNVVAELDRPMPGGGGFYQVHLDMADRAFEIRSHNRRLRIRAQDELTTAEP